MFATLYGLFFVHGRQREAESGSQVNFRVWPLLGDEPPFTPGTSRPLETLLSLFDIYFLIDCPGP